MLINVNGFKWYLCRVTRLIAVAQDLGEQQGSISDPRDTRCEG